MPWRLFEPYRPDKQELKHVSGTARFYADHNLDASIVAVLRFLKFEVETASEVGGERQRDEWHYRRCLQTKRVLLTQDKDFLDHERFPLSQTAGVVVFNIDTGDTAQIARALEVVTKILAGIAPALRQKKFVVNSDYTITMIERVQTDTGFEESQVRYRFDENGRDVWMWEDE